MIEIKVSPPHSVLLFSDLEISGIPPTFQGALVSATETCVAIGCLSSDDGATKVVLFKRGDYQPTGTMVHSGTIATPSRSLLVSTVYGEEIARIEVANALSSIEIWANDQVEPDLIEVLVT